MEIHQLRYFLAIVETGSFSKAARTVNITQPSLSQQIAKLEHELGFTLFDRLPRKIVLTQAGEDLVAHANRIMSEVRDATQRIADRGSEVGGRLVIGAIPTIGPYVLPSLLQRFSRTHPKVGIEIVEETTSGLINRLEHGEIDVALTSTGKAGSAIRFENIARDELLLLLREDHPLAKLSKIRLGHLDGANFLVLQDMHCLAGQVKRLCDLGRVRPKIIVRATQLETLTTMISAGIGVSLVPAMMAAQGLPQGLCTRRFEVPRPTREIVLATNVDRFQTRGAQEFVTILRRCQLF